MQRTSSNKGSPTHNDHQPSISLPFPPSPSSSSSAEGLVSAEILRLVDSLPSAPSVSSPSPSSSCPSYPSLNARAPPPSQSLDYPIKLRPFRPPLSPRSKNPPYQRRSLPDSASAGPSGPPLALVNLEAPAAGGQRTARAVQPQEEGRPDGSPRQTNCEGISSNSSYPPDQARRVNLRPPRRPPCRPPRRISRRKAIARPRAAGRRARWAKRGNRRIRMGRIW